MLGAIFEQFFSIVRSVEFPRIAFIISGLFAIKSFGEYKSGWIFVPYVIYILGYSIRTGTIIGVIVSLYLALVYSVVVNNIGVGVFVALILGIIVFILGKKIFVYLSPDEVYCRRFKKDPSYRDHVYSINKRAKREIEEDLARFAREEREREELRIKAIIGDIEYGIPDDRFCNTWGMTKEQAIEEIRNSEIGSQFLK